MLGQFTEMGKIMEVADFVVKLKRSISSLPLAKKCLKDALGDGHDTCFGILSLSTEER